MPWVGAGTHSGPLAVRRALPDGARRLVGVLAALFQPNALTGGIPLVAIEESGISLHLPVLGACTTPWSPPPTTPSMGGPAGNAAADDEGLTGQRRAVQPGRSPCTDLRLA